MSIKSCLVQVKDPRERTLMEKNLRKYGYDSSSKSDKTLIKNIDWLLIFIDQYNKSLDDKILIEDPNTDQEFRKHYDNLCNAMEFFNNRRSKLVKEFNPSSYYLMED